MREEGLRAKRRKAFVPKTTDSKHEIVSQGVVYEVAALMA
jgi:hypothetical protein